jgi:hypothetical protein
VQVEKGKELLRSTVAHQSVLSLKPTKTQHVSYIRKNFGAQGGCVPDLEPTDPAGWIRQTGVA